MIKISTAVESHVRASEPVFEALRMGVLNLSAYAESITPTIERRCHKTVRPGTIVVALSRLQKKITREKALTPHVWIQDLRLKVPLCDITFEKTNDVVSACRQLASQLSSQPGFLTITEGVNEVTVICSQDSQDMVLSVVSQAPKALFEDLLGVTVRFDETYLQVPNTIHFLLGRLAVRQINVLEIVSTLTELTFIVRRQDSDAVVKAFSKLMR